MTFTYTTIKKTIMGDLKLLYGNFFNSNCGTGGVIDCSGYLHYITFATIQHTGSSAIADSPSVNEELKGLPPRIDKSSFTIKTTANASGLWFATGV